MKNYNTISKTIGICAHSYEGGSLCFLTTCREGAKLMGQHMHPDVLVSAIPMALSMNGWENDNYSEILPHFQKGVEQLGKAGADFFICPDNTAHLVLEPYIDQLPLPGLHIAQVVCSEIKKNGWKKVGLLGTEWTMTGSVYENTLHQLGFEKIIPEETRRRKINDFIFRELCQSEFKDTTIQYFVETIDILKQRGAECVILGCTEIPLIVNEKNSSLPILDSTRLLSKYAVNYALSEDPTPSSGWIEVK